MEILSYLFMCTQDVARKQYICAYIGIFAKRHEMKVFIPRNAHIPVAFIETSRPRDSK